MRTGIVGYALLAAALTLACVGIFAQAVPKIGVCNNCYSDASFEYRAEQTSLASRPLFEGRDFIYVVNLSSEEVRHFQVDRWIEYDAAPYSMGTKSSYDYGSARANAVEIPAEPSALDAIYAAVDATKEFSNQVAQGISADELGLPFDSAIALVGPDGTQASFNRNSMRNAIHQHLNGLWNLMKISMSDLAFRTATRFLSDSAARMLSHITIEFPDGTKIQVRVLRIFDSLNGDVGFDLDVRTDSITGPGLLAVPQAPGEFSGFRYSGNGVSVAELINLALRYNIPVTQDGSGGGGPGEMECEIEGGEIRCKVSYSGY